MAQFNFSFYIEALKATTVFRSDIHTTLTTVNCRKEGKHCVMFQGCIFPPSVQENEVSRLEDIMQHLKSKKQEKWTKASKRQSEKEMEQLHHNIDDLLQEKKDLEYEIEELHRTIEKHQQRK